MNGVGASLFVGGLIVLVLDRVLIHIESDGPPQANVIMTPLLRKKVHAAAIGLMTLGALIWLVSAIVGHL